MKKSIAQNAYVIFIKTAFQRRKTQYFAKLVLLSLNVPIFKIILLIFGKSFNPSKEP